MILQTDQAVKSELNRETMSKQTNVPDAHKPYVRMATCSSLASLHDLMRRHSELFVHPLLWTTHHLSLVGCRFERVIDVSTDCIQHNHKEGEQRPRSGSPSDAERLAMQFSHAVKHGCLVNLLVGDRNAFAKNR